MKFAAINDPGERTETMGALTEPSVAISKKLSRWLDSRGEGRVGRLIYQDRRSRWWGGRLERGK